MKLLIFTQESCPNCPAAKRAIEGIDIKKEYYNIDNPTGLGESAFWDVMSTPTIILVDDESLANEFGWTREIRSWRGKVPTTEEIVHFIGG